MAPVMNSKASIARVSARGMPALRPTRTVRAVRTSASSSSSSGQAKSAGVAATVASAAFQVSQSLPALAYAGGDPLVNPNTGTNGPLGLIATILFVFIPTAFLITVYLKDPGTEKDRFGTR
ncbi:photosystem II reaction centre M protein [Pycnococcus provasolii]